MASVAALSRLVTFQSLIDHATHKLIFCGYYSQDIITHTRRTARSICARWVHTQVVVPRHAACAQWEPIRLVLALLLAVLARFLCSWVERCAANVSFSVFLCYCLNCSVITFCASGFLVRSFVCLFVCSFVRSFVSLLQLVYAKVAIIIRALLALEFLLVSVQYNIFSNKNYTNLFMESCWKRLLYSLWDGCVLRLPSGLVLQCKFDELLTGDSWIL